MTPAANRLAAVWNTIERMAFNPDNRARWLGVFERTLHILWGVQPADVSVRWEAGFDFLPLNVAIQYSVESADRYSVSIDSVAAEVSCCWTVHVDPEFPCKAALYPPPGEYPPRDRQLPEDVATVLDGMIFHPRNHAHGDLLGMVFDLAVAGPGLSCHEIRFGGGIENAFVFLTHLRYQFCLLSEETRRNERTRLVNLFTAAIREKKPVVPPKELFDFRR